MPRFPRDSVRRGAIAHATVAGVCALTATSLAGCDTSVHSTDYDLPPEQCLNAPDHSDLEWLEDNVFTPSCAGFSVCHKGAAASAGGLSLDPGMTEVNTVGVRSRLFPEFNLVEPGDPDASYLLIIMGGAEGPLDGLIGTMPLNSGPLCPEILNSLRLWIDGLAQGLDSMGTRPVKTVVEDKSRQSTDIEDGQDGAVAKHQQTSGRRAPDQHTDRAEWIR